VPTRELELTVFWRKLRSAFPDEYYHFTHKLVNFSQQPDQKILLEFAEKPSVLVDWMVAADGANSMVRKRLLPDVKLMYAGYVAWRGVMPETEMDKDFVSFFDGNFIFCTGEHFHILCYLIPGEDGDPSVGKRRFNWVWYWNVKHGEELNDLLTDKNGQKRSLSVPRGFVRPELIQKQYAIAEQIFPPVIQRLVKKTHEPFIQVIYDVSVPKMVKDRTILIGDAAFVVRPHSAASTMKAAENSLALAETLSECKQNPDKCDSFLQQWEEEQLKLGEELLRYGQRLGTQSQFGKSCCPPYGQTVLDLAQVEAD